MDKNHPLYKLTATAVKTRKSHKVWKCPHVERYVDANFYAFSRCDVLITTTNSRNTVSYEVGFLPWGVGTEVCNIFSPTECYKVSSTGLKVTIIDYDVKVFVPKGTLLEDSKETLLAIE